MITLRCGMDSRPRYFRQRTTEVYLGIKAISLCFQDHFYLSTYAIKLKKIFLGCNGICVFCGGYWMVIILSFKNTNGYPDCKADFLYICLSVCLSILRCTLMEVRDLHSGMSSPLCGFQ